MKFSQSLKVVAKIVRKTKKKGKKSSKVDGDDLGKIQIRKGTCLGDLGGSYLVL